MEKYKREKIAEEITRIRNKRDLMFDIANRSDQKYKNEIRRLERKWKIPTDDSTLFNKWVLTEEIEEKPINGVIFSLPYQGIKMIEIEEFRNKYTLQAKDEFGCARTYNGRLEIEKKDFKETGLDVLIKKLNNFKKDTIDPNTKHLINWEMITDVKEMLKKDKEKLKNENKEIQEISSIQNNSRQD